MVIWACFAKDLRYRDSRGTAADIRHDDVEICRSPGVCTAVRTDWRRGARSVVCLG